MAAEQQQPLNHDGGRANHRPRRRTQTLFDGIDEHVRGIHGEHLPDVLQSIVALRTILENGSTSSFQHAIDRGAVPRLIELMRKDDWEDGQFEAACALTHISLSTFEQTRVIVRHGALDVFVHMLQSESDRIRDQAVCGLGAIASDCVAFRDAELDLGMMNLMLKEVLRVSSQTAWGQAVCAMAKLCYGFPKPPLELMLPCPQLLSEVIMSSDGDVNGDAIWTLFYLCEGGPRGIDAVAQANVIPRLFWFIKQKCKDPSSVKNKIIMSSLCMFSTWFEYGATDQKDMLLHMGLVECMNELSNGIAANAVDFPGEVLKKVCEILCNICEHDPTRIDEILANFPQMVSVSHATRILWAAACYGSDAQHKLMLANESIIRNLMLDLRYYGDLTDKNKDLLVVLKALTRWLSWGNKTQTTSDLGTNKVLLALTQDGGGKAGRVSALENILVAIAEGNRIEQNCRKYGRYLLMKYFPAHGQIDGHAGAAAAAVAAADELEEEELTTNNNVSPRIIENFLNTDDDFLAQLQEMGNKLSKLGLMDEAYVNEMMTAQPKKAGFMA